MYKAGFGLSVLLQIAVVYVPPLERAFRTTNTRIVRIHVSVPIRVYPCASSSRPRGLSSVMNERSISSRRAARNWLMTLVTVSR
jgi:hypothetical protein